MPFEIGDVVTQVQFLRIVWNLGIDDDGSQAYLCYAPGISESALIETRENTLQPVMMNFGNHEIRCDSLQQAKWAIGAVVRHKKNKKILFRVIDIFGAADNELPPLYRCFRVTCTGEPNLEDIGLYSYPEEELEFHAEIKGGIC